MKKPLISWLWLAICALVMTPASAAPTLPLKPRPAPFLETWALLGTFAVNDRDTEDASLAVAKTAPAIGTRTGGKMWEYFDDRLFIRNRDDYQDLFSYYSVKKSEATEDKTAFVHTYVFSPSARAAVLYVGSHGGFRAWVNGVPVGSFAGKRLALRDESACPLALRAGWNRVLLQLTSSLGAWGFYARLGDRAKNALPGVIPSVGGGAGPLLVATAGLPGGYQGQSYVAVDVAEADNVNNAHASPFRLQAQGGTPPYTWTVGAGPLPTGLTLRPDGVLEGDLERTGQTTLVVRVTDRAHRSAMRTLTLTVTEVPADAFALSRLVADVNPDRGELKAEAVLPVLKSAGFRCCYVSAVHDAAPDWPAPGFPRLPDYITPFSQAARKSGLRFGVYVSLYNTDLTRPAGYGANEWRMALIRDIVRRWNPDLYWFDEIRRASKNDWRTGLTANREWDALHSYIRACNPNAVILMNDGTQARDGRGDIDLLEMEGTRGGYWGHWPVLFPAAPRLPVESWRYVGEGGAVDWAEWMKVCLSLIGEGRIADLPWEPEGRVVGSAALFGKAAAWMSPPGLPSKALALVDTVPVPTPAGPWGYAVRSRADGSLYLYLLSNPRGKTGLPAAKTLIVNIPKTDVASARVLNDGHSVPFTQTGDTVRLDLRGVPTDPVAAIIQLRLSSHPGSASHPSKQP